jgi:hypothetical protein
MAAKFIQLYSNVGVDDNTPIPTVIVPLDGFTLIGLKDGKGLQLKPNKANITIDEFPPSFIPMMVSHTQDMSKKWAFNLNKLPPNLLEKAKEAMVGTPLPNDARIFGLQGDSLGGTSQGTEIKAIHPKTGAAVTKLLAVVLKQRKVKISIRPVQVRDGSGNIVFHSKNKFDVQELKESMNWIWAQANVSFELVSSQPVLIDDRAAIAKALNLQANTAPLPAKININDLGDLFAKEKDPNADFTFFLVNDLVTRERGRPNAPMTEPRGVADSDRGIALLADDMTWATPAHEAGHLLGFHGRHSAVDPKSHRDRLLLMKEGGPDVGPGKIPFIDIVQVFNKGYK